MAEKKYRGLRLRPKSGAGEGKKDESAVRWLISYADFMMQLVCLFILLFSVSSLEISKISRIARAWRQEAGLEPLLLRNVPPDAEELPLTMEQIPQTLKQIEEEAGRYLLGQQLRLSQTSDGFRMQIVHPLFEEGSSQLTGDGVTSADVAARLLRPYQRRVASIEIVGHTAAGDREVEQGSALRLSMSRARRVYARVTSSDAPWPLEEKGLAAGGRGPHDPVSDHRSPKAREFNRTVEFLVRVVPAKK